MANWKQEGYDPSEHGWHRGTIDCANNFGYASNYFYAGTMRGIDIAVGCFFNNFHIYHFDQNGEPIKEIEIPIKYGPRTKAFDQRVELKDGKQYYIPLPNMTYQETGCTWDGTRASGMGEERVFYAEYFEQHGIKTGMQNKFWSDIQPVPYNITYELVGHFEYRDDANQFREQILARFAPECYLNVKEFWFVNLRRSLQFKLEDCSMECNVEFGEEDKREITVTCHFTVAAWFYKPIKYGAIIDQIVTQLRVSSPNTTHAWQQDLRGNYEGGFDYRHNFGEIYGTKIGRVSAVDYDRTVSEYSPSGFYTRYAYNELADITNYPASATQLFAVSSFYDFDKTVFNKVAQIYPGDESAKNPRYIPIESACSAILREEDFSDGKTYRYDVSNPNGTTTIKASLNLSGWGDFDSAAVWRVGTKDVDLGTKVVSAAPYIASAGVIEEDR